MLRTIIIDDEQQARLALRQEIDYHCPKIKIIAEANSVRTAIEVIRQHQPDLIFLDIQLTDGIGFEILQAVADRPPRVIFTTAYSEYALRAIKFSALDYLLKPVDGEELAAAVGKIELQSNEHYHQQIENFIQNNQADLRNKRIALATSDGIHLYALNEIIRCTSEGNYTTLYFTNKRKLLIAKTLKEMEELLCHYHFERIHKSHIINLEHLVSYLSKDNGHVLLSDDTLLSVSQRKKPKLLALLGSING